MKTLNKILALALLIGAGCSKDLGNYEYTEVNTYSISDIRTGLSVARNYNVVMGQHLRIEPTIESAQEDSNPDLSYLWIIEKDTVSRERVLNYQVDLPIALHQAQFVLIDNKTGLRNAVPFGISVTSPYGRGYFFLNQDEQNNTILSFKAVSDTNNIVVNTDNIGGTKFGQFPLKMAGVQRFRTGPTDYSWEVYVVSKESENPVVLADLTRYEPLRFFKQDGYMGTWGNQFQFNPTHVELRSSGKTFFISNGKVALFDGSNLYRQGLLFDNTPDYKLDNILIGDINRIHGIQHPIGFDLTSSRFKVLSAYPSSDPSKGIVFNANILDRVLDIESPAGLLDGHRVAGAFSAYISTTRLLNSRIFTIKDDHIHLINLNAEFVAPYVPVFEHIGSQAITGLSVGAPLTFFENATGDAYLAIDNKIYKSSIIALGFNEFLTIPTDIGQITAVKYQNTSVNSAGAPRLFVCTYDPSSSAELKGSILVYDVNTKTLVYELKNVTNKVVDIFLGE